MPSPQNLFDLFTEDHTVQIPSLPVTELVRLDTPTLYAIHDHGLIGTGECLWVGQTEQPFERIYAHFAKRSGAFWSRTHEDSEAATEPAEEDGGSNYLYENLRLSVTTVEDPEQLDTLEAAAIGRLGPRYNERDRYTGGYLDLSSTDKTTVNRLLQEPLVPPKIGGTYALVALDIPGTPIEQGECLKTGHTGNLISRLTDHVRNTKRTSCLRWKLENEFPVVDWSASLVRSHLTVAFTAAGVYEDEWATFFSPRYPE